MPCARVLALSASEPAPSWLRDYLGFWLGHPARRVQYASLLAVLWLAAFGSQWFSISKDVAGARRTLGVSAETAYVPPVPVLRMASLGHQSFAADLLFLRAAHYFVQHLMSDSRLPWIDLYLQGIWGLDAHDRGTYHWGSQVIKFGQQIDTEVARRANHFARLGLANFPDDPWLYHEIAYNLRYTMEPKDDAEAARNKDLALQYLEIAYSFPGFQYDPNYLASQYSRAGRGEDAVRAALETYDSASEDQRRELRLLLEERDKPQVAAELAWFDAVHQRDWTYLPETLALLVGPKRVTAPPLPTADPGQWLREPPLPEDLKKRMGLAHLLPPADERAPPDEDVTLATPPTVTTH
jgi:hypothetical protein